MSSNDTSTTIARLASWAVIGLGILSLLTAAYFTSGERLLSQSVPGTGGIVGPVQITEAGTVLDIHVRQPQNLPSSTGRGFSSGYGTSNSTWSFVEGEVLDEEQEYLFGFGDELWKETGYDGSYWTESKDDFELKVTIPDPGTYYFGFNTQAAPGSNPGDIQVRVDEKRGSAIPHFVFGLCAILLGLLMRFMITAAGQSSAAGAMEGA